MFFGTRDEATGQGHRASRHSAKRRVRDAARSAIRHSFAEALEERRLFATFIVTTTADSGAGSLRQAISDANDLLGADTILFNIGVGGAATITPDSPLPEIVDPVVIDGYSQPLPGGDQTTVPLIELDGSATGGDGLHISGGNSTIRGLVINDFEDGIRITNVGGNTIAGCYIGMDITGTVGDGNNDDGIDIEVGDNVIGLPELDLGEGDPAITGRNIISSNGDNGIEMSGSSGNIVQNNLIGVDVTGQVDHGNDGDGIRISSNDSTGNLIGGEGDDEGNIIAFNGGAGIIVTSGSGHTFLSNGISENDDLGIDLGEDGIDGVDELDADSGPNDRMNRPVLSGAPTVGGITVVSGLVRSLPNSDFRVQIFTDFDPDEDAGEGQIFLEAFDVETDASGVANFEVDLPVFIPFGRAITATSTLLAPGGFPLSTSEFSLILISGTTPGINVEGNGDTIVSGDDTPQFSDGTDFGSVDLDEAGEVQNFVITNTGSSILNLTGTPRVQIIGPDAADFTVTDQPIGSFDPDEDDGFTIVFNPSTPGLKQATVVIPNTDPDENPYTFDIQGTGTQKSVSITGDSIIEGNAGVQNLVFTVTLSSVSSQDVSILYSTADVTAVAGEDYTPISGGIATIIAGQTSTTVAVPIIGDTIFEEDEVFSVIIESTGDVVTDVAEANGIIINDEPPPVLSISDAQVVEGQTGISQLVYTVSIPQPSTLPILVNYSTADGTATAGADYTAASGTASIPVGQTSATITIEVKGERVVESDETLFLNLSSPLGVTIGDAQAMGTIINDDRTFSITAASGTVVEAPGSAAQFIITLDDISSEEIRISYGTQNGTATAPADYTPAGGTLVFAPGETTKTVSVGVAADTLVEGDETFSLALFNAVNAGVTQDQFSITVEDSTLPSLALDSRQPVTFTDSNGDTVTITMRGPGQALVQFADTAGVGDPVALILDGTSGGTTVTISASGAGTNLGGVNINRPIKAIVAPNVDLVGGFVARGGIRNLQFRDVDAADQTLSILPRGNVNLKFNRVNNLNIESSAKIGTLAVGEWVDESGSADTVRAPGIKQITVTSNFAADVRTGTLNKMFVGGSLIGSDIRNTVGIKQLSAGAISNSVIFVGVSEDFTGLPSNDEDFFNDAGYIKKLNTGTFSNTLIGAPVQGTITLGAVQTENANTPLGVSADKVKALTGTTNRGPLVFSKLNAPQNEQEDDFVLRIYE